MIDLHIHTNASDGADNVAELLEKCENLGLSVISITDHNSVAAYQQLQDPAVRSRFRGKILPGCEFSAHYLGQAIEILGYGICISEVEKFLSEAYIDAETRKKLQQEQMIDVYQKRGFVFNEEQVRANFRLGRYPGTERKVDVRTSFWMELNRYPENQEKYSCTDSCYDYKSFMRREFANINSPFFFSMEQLLPSAEMVCAAIKRMGGKAVVAHPGGYNQAVYDMMEEMIQAIKPHGLEAWYSIHSLKQKQELSALCEKYDLIISGGSDYHGEWRVKAGNVLGMPELEETFPLEQILTWIEQETLI